MTGHRALRRWHAEAAPVLVALIRAEDRTLAAIDCPITLVACCDQLEAAFDHAEEWLYDHPCPDAELGRNFDVLIRACGGMLSILSTGVHAEHAYKERCAEYLAERISEATESREYLQRWQSTGIAEL
jgi:hypothetical protein